MRLISLLLRTFCTPIRSDRYIRLTCINHVTVQPKLRSRQKKCVHQFGKRTANNEKRIIFEIFSGFFLTLTERLTHGKQFVFWQTFCFTVVNTLFTGGLRNIVFTGVFHHRTRVFSHFPGQQIHVNARKRLVLGCSPIA